MKVTARCLRGDFGTDMFQNRVETGKRELTTGFVWVGYTNNRGCRSCTDFLIFHTNMITYVRKDYSIV